MQPKPAKSIIAVMVLLAVLAIGGVSYSCSGIYAATDRGSRPFSSDRVVTVRIVMSAEDWEYTQRNSENEQYVTADFWFGDELVPEVAVRPKGLSSLNAVARSDSARMSLKVDFNFFNSARTLYGLKKVNLNNGYSDPTLIRETLGYELFEQMGLPTPRTCFVDLWVNDTHLGVYTMVEQIDRTFLEEHFVDASGNLYKPEMPAAYLNWTETDLPEGALDDTGDELDINLGGGKFSEIMRALEPAEETEEETAEDEVAAPGFQMQPGDMFPGDMAAGNMTWRDMPQINMPQRDAAAGNIMPGNVPFGGMQLFGGGNYLEQMGLKTNENNPDYSGLLSLLEVLNNEPDETFREEIERVLDVDQVLRYLAVSTVLVHLDNYTGMGHNYYLYEVDGKFTIIPWDLNMAFGTFNSGLNRDGIINFYIDEPTAGRVADRPLVARLLAVPAYLETYHGYLEELIDRPFSYEVMEARIDELAALIRPYVAADELKFYATEDFEKGLDEDVRTGIRVSGMGMNIGLKAFVAERVESIREQLEGTRASGSGNGSGNGGSFMMGGQFGLEGANLRPR